jgi:hypothetical protein
MKLKIEKKLADGSYTVDVETLQFSADEQNRIEKFGSPMVSLEPKIVTVRRPAGGFVTLTSIAIHALNHTFNFNNENEAEDFVRQMTDRIRTAITELKNKRDDFTGEKEYEF